MRYWNRLFAAFLSVSVLPLNWHTHYSRAFRTGTVLAHAVDAEYPGIREQEQILTRGGVTCSLVPRPRAFVACSTKFCANFVLQATNARGLGTRLGYTPNKVLCGGYEGSATARLGVRDFEIHWISRGFRISEWISGFQNGFLDFKWISGFRSGFLDFKVDFWISKWISGFQSGFLDFKVDFWTSKWISGFQSGFLDFI